MEIRGLGGADFERALQDFRSGEPVTYRGMELVVRGGAFECRVVTADAPEDLTSHRALDALTKARFRLGALLTSAPPLEAIIGNREPRLVLLAPADRGGAELYELRHDRLRRLGATPPPGA